MDDISIQDFWGAGERFGCVPIRPDLVYWAAAQVRPLHEATPAADPSLFVLPAARGQGIGKPLLNGVIDAAAAAGFWKILSRIFTFNTASRALCAACGFREVGIYENHGKLDGRWLDVVIVERLIDANLT